MILVTTEIPVRNDKNLINFISEQATAKTLKKSGFHLPATWDLKEVLKKLNSENTTIAKWVLKVINETILEFSDSPDIKFKLYTFKVPENTLKMFNCCVKRAGFNNMSEFWRHKCRLLQEEAKAKEAQDNNLYNK